MGDSAQMQPTQLLIRMTGIDFHRYFPSTMTGPEGFAVEVMHGGRAATSLRIPPSHAYHNCRITQIC